MIFNRPEGAFFRRWSSALIVLRVLMVMSLTILTLLMFVATLSASALEAPGLVWERINSPQVQAEIRALLAMDGSLYVATSNGLFRSENKGDSWTQVNMGLTDLSLSSLTTLSATIFASSANGGGVFRSEDKGDSWTQINDGLTNVHINTLMVLGQILFAGTSSGEFFRFEDKGETWSHLGQMSLRFSSLTVLGATIFVGVNGKGVFRSEDNGKSWTQVDLGLTDLRVSSLATSDTSLFAGTNGGGVFRSENKGDSWTQANIGLTNFNVNSLAVLDAFVFAGTAAGLFRASTKVPSALSALDVNKDGEIDIFDLVIVANAFGQLAAPNLKLEADVNADGKIDTFDLILVTIHFGAKVNITLKAAPARQASDQKLVSEALSDVVFLTQLKDLLKSIPNPSSGTLKAIAELESLVSLAFLTKPVVVVKETKLLTNYPNPFNPETWIPYQLANLTEVKIRIYNVSGKQIRTLNLGRKEAGLYLTKAQAAYWDGRNEAGEQVSSGIYFYELTTGNFRSVKKMVVLK